MCGLLGEVSNNLLSNKDFKSLLALSIHRGPDQQGYWSTNNCQIGFNRLAIIDLSENALQPVLSPNNKYALVFNGEVYNYKELQHKYNILDEELRSKSDSEVLAHLIEKLDINDFANELNGMFAIAIYDLEQEKVHLIRDFAGIKPLYYGLFNRGIVFASQFDQIFKHSAFKDKRLRPEIMKEYLALGYMHAPNTVFDNIFQVMPGQIITWSYSISRVEQSDYYTWKVSKEYDETNVKVIEDFEVLFEEALKRQLNSDVKIATFLSGGVDSPLVTAFAKKNKKDIKAFTIGVDDEKFDESKIAKKYAEQLQVDQLIECFDANQMLSIIDDHFKALSEPLGDYSSLPTYLITKKAKKYATVMLSGDGGDELFWGYPRFIKSAEQALWFRLPLFLRKVVIPILRKFIPNLSYAIEIEKNFGNWVLSKQIHLKTEKLMPNYSFTKELNDTYVSDNNSNKSEVLVYLKKNEYYAHLQKVLKKVDLMSMANSLEVRVPFLDKKIIEFSNKIEPQLTKKHRTPKFVLKKMLAKIVSDDLVYLPKRGFSIPIEDWIKNELADDVKKVLLQDDFYGAEFIDKQEVKTLVDDFFQGKTTVNPWGIWHVYSWQKWAQFHLK